uniref:Protein takeout n=1 Tax=Cacopsylla melanoneura TaxID=428564 RepID=A0A8D8VKZ9_9HEMI
MISPVFSLRATAQFKSVSPSVFSKRVSSPLIICASLILGVLSLVSNVHSVPAPSPVNIGNYHCKQKSPTFDECVKKATVLAKPYIAKGVPSLAIPPVEPFSLPMIMLEQGTGAVNYKANLKDIKITGLSEYKFDDIKVDMPHQKVSAKVHIPVLFLESDYEINGRALLVPIRGMGLFKANLTSVNAQIRMMGKIIKKKGQEYFEAKDTEIKLNIGDAQANFGNLFNGDSLLSEATNKFINENAKDIVDEVKPAIEMVASMLLDDIANKIFKNIPVSKVFPE